MTARPAGGPAWGVLAAVAFAAAPAAPASAATHAFDIPAGPLDRALAAFALQAGVSIGGEGLPRRQSPGVSGRLSTAAALDRLLRGTGIEARFVDATTVRLSVARARPPAPAPRQTTAALPPEEIIVTATRRRAPAATLPISIGTLDAAALDAGGAVASADALRGITGIVTTNLGSGRDKIFIRGLSDGSFTGRTESTVSVYLDDARATYSAPDPDLRLVDVERVEVLRGPQSLLYGAGSLGGIYRVVTRPPEMAAAGAAGGTTLAATRHGAPSWRGDAMINLPLAADRAALRLVAYRERDGGYIDDPGRGDDVNRTDVSGARAALRLTPSSAWTVDLAGAFQDIEARDGQYADPRVGALARRTALAEPHDNDFRLGRATVAGAIGALRVESTTAFVDHAVSSRYDAGAALPRLAGRPVEVAAFDERQQARLFSHETRLRPAHGDAWLAGVSLLHGDTDYAGALIVRASGATAYAQRQHDDVREVAAFVTGELPLTARLALGGGVRLVSTRLASDAARTGDDDSDRSVTRTRALPSLSLSWKPAPGRLAYVLLTTGDRAGGLNASAAGDDREEYASDRLWSAEIGGKLRTADGAFELDASAFAVRWTNIQTDQLLPSGLLFTTNAGDGRNIGVEASLTARPAAGVAVRLHAMIDDPELADPAAAFRGGAESPLPGVPNEVGGIEASYTTTLGAADLRIGANARYVGRSRLLLDPGQATAQGGYATVDPHLLLTHGGASLRLFVDNLFDRRANSFSFGNPFSFATSDQRTPLRPRTVGVSLRLTR